MREWSAKWTFCVVLVAALAGASAARAGWMGPGCWSCVEESQDLVGMEERCTHAGHEQTGTGTNCNQINFGAFGWSCYTTGDPCFNVDVGGGGGGAGGGGGGGGTGGCSVSAGSGCPAWCSSCEYIYF